MWIGMKASSAFKLVKKHPSILVYAFLGKREILIRHNQLDIEITRNLWSELQGLQSSEPQPRTQEESLRESSGVVLLM